jgi:hypothetical protein
MHDLAAENTQDHHIAPAYVNQYAWQIKQADVQLHNRDMISIRLWIDFLFLFLFLRIV